VLLLYLWLLSLPEINNDDAHVITAFALRSINIWRKKSVHKTLANFGNLHLPLHLYVNVVDNLLTCFGLPDAVTPYDHKVRLVGDLVHLNVWE
jgi:hypothetical protein